MLVIAGPPEGVLNLSSVRDPVLHPSTVSKLEAASKSLLSRGSLRGKVQPCGTQTELSHTSGPKNSNF